MSINGIELSTRWVILCLSVVFCFLCFALSIVSTEFIFAYINTCTMFSSTSPLLRSFVYPDLLILSQSLQVPNERKQNIRKPQIHIRKRKENDRYSKTFLETRALNTYNIVSQVYKKKKLECSLSQIHI